MAADLGAWAVGMVFYPDSPRRCSEQEAALIGAALKRRCEIAGVFVNATIDYVVEAAENYGLTLIQLHGDEGPAYCSEVARRSGAKVIKASPIRTRSDITDLIAHNVDYYLFDGYSGGFYGGTGQTFDWQLLSDSAQSTPFILSGGLTPENVAEGIKAVRPFAVDVASGVEAYAGKKDSDKLEAFFAAARSVDKDEIEDAQKQQPQAGGDQPEQRFGRYGGRYVPETLMPALAELTEAYASLGEDRDFQARLQMLLRDYCGRPTPLYLAQRLSEKVGYKVYLKREDLLHTGAHKINNALAQALLAQKMGKRRIIAETGAGQHGVAVATVSALLDLECVVYMGTEDIRRQQPNVERMELLGAKVVAVEAGARTLKEAVSEAIRDWVTNVAESHYIIGSVVGPAPFPAMVRDFQAVIGGEARAQMLDVEGALPQQVIACVGGGSNSIGIFKAFLEDAAVELIGVEAGGEGIDSGRHGAALLAGSDGVLHGSYSRVMQDSEGQIVEAHSVSAGLDYPGTGPQHAHLRESGRVFYQAVNDSEAIAAFKQLSLLEGIIPALESAHAIAWLLASDKKCELALLCLSGRGDKDMAEVAAYEAK